MPEVWYLKHIRKLEKLIRELKKLLFDKDKEIKDLKEKILIQEIEIKRIAEQKKAKRPKFPSYNLSLLEKEGKEEKVKGKSSGRRSKEEKAKQVTIVENVYPEDIKPEKCSLMRERVVTRVLEGKKEIFLYRVFKEKWGSKKGEIPEVLAKSEYGIEVPIILSFLIFGLELSYSQAIEVLKFFCQIELSTSQVDSLLNQLAKEWEKEFESLADLILFSLVVYIDETGWKVDKKNTFAWIFKSLKHTLLLYGESREEKILDQILPTEEFKGVGVTDCYKIYEKRFPQAQKCWAHFLRKIIRLTLLYPEKEIYKIFLEKLAALFKEGKKIKSKETLTCQEKEKRAEELMKKVEKICTKKEIKLSKDTPKDFREFVNLQKNLIRNKNDLFTYVFHEEVEPTNNIAERGFRDSSRARNNYQTSKTLKGAKKRSIIKSTLASLRQNLDQFSLEAVLQETVKWRREGKSLFQRQLEAFSSGIDP